MPSFENPGFKDPPPAYSTATQPGNPPAQYDQQQYDQPQYGQSQYGQPQYGQPQFNCTQQVVVSQPGQPGVIMTQVRPPDHMIPAVCVCLCCFWPTGLCAIYYACRANTLAGEGNMIEAARMSNNARNLIITSVGLGIICSVMIIVFRVVLYSSDYY